TLYAVVVHMGVHTNASMNYPLQNELSGSFCVRTPHHFGIILYERSLRVAFFAIYAIIDKSLVSVGDSSKVFLIIVAN
ncbi:MAG: hypothetical protein Q8P52_03275, partial [bacterium]|nr:hypothetical protein [bacterium]